MEATPKNNPISLENDDSSMQLVEEASAGCSDSFRQLVEQNQRRIRLYLGKYVRCSTQVDDIAQEVFLVAFKQLGNFRGEAKFSTWLFGIARNKALEFLKAEAKDRKSQKKLFEAEVATQQFTRLRSAGNYDLEEQRILAMQSCLDQLPKPSRELIDRYYFDHQTATSIANQSNISNGAVRMKLLRIRQILLKCIMARSQDPDDKQPVTEFDK
jgi:RNA polymerase sigma-70 factor (ECF subfamily)